MKIALFFALAFLLMLVPFVVAALMGFRGPPPYVVVGPGPGPEWASGRDLPDKTRVTATPYATEHDAAAAMKTALSGIRMSAQSDLMGVRRYTRADDGRHGWVAPVGRWVVRIEGPDRATVDASRAALPFLADNPEKNPLWLAFTEFRAVTFAAIGAYALFYLVALARGAAWAARIDPATATVAPPEVLEKRLLALETLDLPFQVTRGPDGRFVAEWRVADARWAGPMQAGGLKIGHRIHLDLDPDAHRVRVVDEERKVSWKGEVGAMSGRASFFRGISFARVERGAAVGLLFDAGGVWSVRPAYDYRFRLDEMKGPLIDVVTGSGWTWQPVVTFFRPVGG